MVPMTPTNTLCQEAASQPDATALEAQYKTCAQHDIPSDKCTPEIYQQLKTKDDAPLDPATSTTLTAVKEYQTKMRNPESMQVLAAYVTEKDDVCLDIGGQNTMGGMTTSKVVYAQTKKGARWVGLNQNKFSPGNQPVGFGLGAGTDSWSGFYHKGTGVFHALSLKDGLTDVTNKLNHALKAGK